MQNTTKIGSSLNRSSLTDVKPAAPKTRSISRPDREPAIANKPLGNRTASPLDPDPPTTQATRESKGEPPGLPGSAAQGPRDFKAAPALGLAGGDREAAPVERAQLVLTDWNHVIEAVAAIREDASLEAVSVEAHGLSPADVIAAFVPVLLDHPKIAEVKFVMPRPHAIGANVAYERLVELLGNPRLQKLVVSGIRTLSTQLLRDGSFLEFCEALQQNTTLVELGFADRCLHPKDTDFIGQALTQNATLETLDLATAIDPEWHEDFIRASRDDALAVDPEDIRTVPIAKHLKALKGLRHLNVSHNALTWRDIESIGRLKPGILSAIPFLRFASGPKSPVETIDLRHCNLPTWALTELSLVARPGVSQLELGYNQPLTPERLEALRSKARTLAPDQVATILQTVLGMPTDVARIVAGYIHDPFAQETHAVRVLK